MQYRFSFALETVSQVPGDFVLPPDLGTLHAGVFLPADDADWRGRRRYSPRILLLCGSEVVIVPHPAAGEPTVRVPLERIERIEWGRILLTGWIVLSWDTGDMRLPYNTRSRGPVEACVKALLDRWLPPQGCADRAAKSFGAPLDLKFRYALAAELVVGEVVLAQFFQPGDRGLRRRFWFHRSESAAGDLVLITSRRLLWVTERHKGKYGRYGAVSHSARISSIAGARCSGTSPRNLEIAFRRGEPWRVPVRDDLKDEARVFEAEVGTDVRGDIQR